MDEILDEATCRSATPGTRRASGARRARPARTRAACSASTSSTRSSCSSSASRRTRPTSTTACSRSRRRSSRALGFPYRVVNVAAGDLGASAAKKYDIEAWFPHQQRYREITSTSNTTDFQARRLGIRYRARAEGHRVRPHAERHRGHRAGLLAIIENFQAEDGSIAVPSVLEEFGAPAKVGAAT